MAETPTLNVRAGVHDNFDRLVFDWPQSVAYTLQKDGGRVTVTFDSTAQTAWQTVMLAHVQRATGFVSSADAAGHLIVNFYVNPTANIKDFVSGHSVVIDITGNLVGNIPETTTLERAQDPQKQTQATPETTAPEKQELPVAAPPTNTATAPTPKAAPFESVKIVAQEVAQKPMTFPDLTDAPTFIAGLDPHVAMRAVAYQRGGYAYIVFERKLSLDLAAITTGQAAPRVTLERLDLPEASGYRFAIPDKTEIRVSRDNTAWQIFANHQQPNVPVSASLIAQPDFALGARYILPLPDAPEPIRLTDPVIGDNLILVPLEQTQAFSVVRHMAEFQILPAAQGLVLRPMVPQLLVRHVTDGVEITSDGGLQMSSTADTGAAQESASRTRTAATGKFLFDFAIWRGKGKETFTEARQRLQQTVVDVPEAERDRARLELARFYFAYGNGREASALLEYLGKRVPDLYSHADFRALLGATKILSYRPEEGLKNFDMPALANQSEIELWEAVANAQLRNWEEAEKKFFSAEKTLAGYPEPFYSHFSVLAIESALAENKDAEAADWLQRLETDHHDPAVEPAISFLHGILDAKSGHAQKAQISWKDAASASDRLYKVRSEMALIDLGVSTRSLTPAQAADRLEALRFAWRGDDLELDILHRLGQFYIQAKNVKSGLATMARGIQLYPNSALSPVINDEMAHVFHDVFLAPLGDQLSPLDALTIYQQYRNLMPSGKDGENVMRNLAERLVAVDLLDQAASLLEDLIRNRLQGEDKGHVTARLAGIRLLDHKPDMAIEALDMANNNYPPELQNERLILRAKALSEMQKFSEALTLIKDNNSETAKLLRAEINMHAHQWGDASLALMDLVGAPPAAEGKPLSSQQADWLVSAAIATSLAGDTAGLDKLRNDYGAAMASMPQNDTFHILTEPEKFEISRDVAAAQSKITDVDLFRGFLDTYRKSAAPKKAPPTSSSKL